MYDVTLSVSHFPAQSDLKTREITIGALLREVAAARPGAEALVEAPPSEADKALRAPRGATKAPLGRGEA